MCNLGFQTTCRLFIVKVWGLLLLNITNGDKVESLIEYN